MKKTAFLSVLLGTLLSLNTQANNRLVAIDGSLTEIIYALDAQSQLVAVDSTSTYPQQVKKLPNVGYMRALSTEGLLSVKPQTVITTDSARPQQVLQQLKVAGVDVQIIKNDFSIAGIYSKVDAVAKIVDKKEEGIALKKHIADKLQPIEKMLSEQNGKKKPKVLIFLSMQGNQLMAAGKNTQAQAVLDILKADNAVSQFNGYKPLNKEAVLSTNADAILLLTKNSIDQSTANLDAKKQFIYSKAASNDKIRVFDTTRLLGFGPRFPGALKEVAELLYSNK